MFENAFRLGSVAGIRIGVHYTWFIIFFLLSFMLYTLKKTNELSLDTATMLEVAATLAGRIERYVC